MLLAQPLAVPCGVPTMESYLPLLSLKLAEGLPERERTPGNGGLIPGKLPGCLNQLCRVCPGFFHVVLPHAFWVTHSFTIRFWGCA